MGKIALVFPGQGSQAVGMAKDFFDNFRQSQLAFEEASDAIHVDLRKLCFEGPLDELTLTPNLQPALFVTEASMILALRQHAEPDVAAVAGHSLGEYSALFAAGSLSLTDGVRLTRLRGSAMQDAVPAGRGTMAAILGLNSEAIEALCAKAREAAAGEVVEPANFNAPGQIVIAGSIDGVAQASEITKSDPQFKGAKAIPLQVSAPFHCSLMAPAQLKMEPLLIATAFHPPLWPLIPNVTADPTKDEKTFAKLLTQQITQPVRWEQSMRRLRELGIESLVEIGPGKVLVGLHKRIDREMPAKSISSVETMKEAFK